VNTERNNPEEQNEMSYHVMWKTIRQSYSNTIQQDATEAGIYLLQNYSICFGCLSHPSSGIHQTVTAASGTGHIT